MFILLLNLVAAIVTVILGRRNPRALTFIGLGALAFGVVACGVALASGQWVLFYVVALAASYGLAVRFGRLIVALLRAAQRRRGSGTRLTERRAHNCRYRALSRAQTARTQRAANRHRW